MRTYALSFLAIAALCASTAQAAPSNAGAAGPAPQQMLSMLSGSWSCQTTEADGLNFTELDQGQPIGTNWLHGTARPDPRLTPQPNASPEPYYDYYLGFIGTRWVYIQVNPSHGTYFVGLSDGATLVPSNWTVVYPSRQGRYTFTATTGSFTIAHPDLTQVCQQANEPLSSLPALPLNCSTWYARTGALAELGYKDVLKISQPQPGVPWWQGVARDAAGNVVYAYDIFDVGQQRVALLVNVTTGAFTFSKSALLKDLNDTVWMVDYPTVENGFAFTNVRYQNNVPTTLRVVFKDGFQDCASSS